MTQLELPAEFTRLVETDRPLIGSLCSGYGGLDLAVEEVTGGKTVWVSDVDPGACTVLEHRFPDAPNIGDMTAVDWNAVPPVEVVCAGYPCQPFSLAGRRGGTTDERHLWPYLAEGIDVLEPELLVFENVRGHLSLGFDQVVRDLHLLGYDAHWTLAKASDVGAPHRRERIFITARRR
ncbi:DNA cytosine methyltransferase [Brevibacterium casei]|uniref:DNA cytosine methyltransferase n=1 Tax=Brevibacterium casei TaxID=33889 RepID=UPI0039F0F752